MKENITKAKSKGKTDWKKVKSMSEEEIVRNASEDSDAPFLTDADLSGFKRVTPTPNIDVKKIRNNLHMTQEDFSQYFGFNLKTLRDWEQHRREPSGAARNLLKVIELEPKVVQRVLSTN
jgi:putative transcriptional regulator